MTEFFVSIYGSNIKLKPLFCLPDSQSIKSSDPSTAQASPGAVALAGPGGVAGAAPKATALAGKGGLAVSSPQATAVAGTKREKDTKKPTDKAATK